MSELASVELQQPNYIITSHSVASSAVLCVENGLNGAQLSKLGPTLSLGQKCELSFTITFETGMSVIHSSALMGILGLTMTPSAPPTLNKASEAFSRTRKYPCIQ